MNLLEILPRYCLEVQKSGRAVALKFLENQAGYSPELCVAVVACCSDKGKLQLSSGKPVTFMDLMPFQKCM